MSRNAQQRTWADWFKSNKSKRTQRRPALEMLEDRAVPAVTVTTLQDGPDAAQPIAGSLRAAIIEAARTDGKIDFAPALFTSGSLPKTLVLNGAVGSIILNSGKNITITGPGADKLIIQSDIGFTSATGSSTGNTFKQGNQLRQKADTTGSNGYQGGAIFTVTSINDSADGILGNFVGSITGVAVTNPGSNSALLNQQVTLSQSGSGQFQLEPINGTIGTGASITIQNTSYGLNPGIIEQSMQIAGANTLTVSGIHFGDTTGNVIKQNLGNLVVDNCIFDNANTFGTARQVTNFIFADVGAGTLTVTDSTFTNASLRAIDISNGAGNLTITGTAAGKSIFAGNDVAAISASASKIAISQTSITANGDGPNGTGPLTLNGTTSVTLNNVSITNNIINASSTATQGGALIQGNTITLTNPTITGNVPNSKSTQGTIRLQSSGSVTISGAVVDLNNPNSMSSYRALEILGNPSKTTISESVFSNNTAGGALAIVSQSTNISKSYFNNNESNKTNNAYGTTNLGTTGGSALITTGSGLTSITQSVFTNNKLSSVTTANSGGAAIFSGNGGLAIDKSVFENNSVAITGYPTPSPLPDPTIYSSNPEKQPAPRYSGGGAIRSGAGTTITNSEIAFNSVTSVVDFWLPPNAISPANQAIPAYSGGGGVYISNDTGGNTTNQIINTTFFGNSVVQTGQTNSGNANIQSTGKGLNGGAVILADGRNQGGANYSASDPFRGGNSTTRFVNTTITNNSLVNPFADKNNSNYLSGVNGFNNSDTGGVFNDTNSGSSITTLNTINVQNTGIIYNPVNHPSNPGDPNFGIANTGNRFSNNGVGTFGSSGYSMFNPATSPGFTFNGTKGNLIGSDQNAGIDSLGLQNNLGTAVGVTPVTGVAATTNANAIVRSVSIDRLSPARDTGLDVTQAGNNPTNPVIAITTDVRNVPRAINVAVDMGAVELQTATKSSVVTSTPLSLEYGQVQTVTTRVDFDDSKASVTPISGVMRIVSIIPDTNGNNVVTEYGRATLAPVTGSSLPASDTTITLNGDATVAGLPLLPPGTNILYAQYLGDNSYVDSQSAPFTVTIAPATTTTTLNASVPNPADAANATKISISGSVAITHPSATPVSTGLFPIGTVTIGQKQVGSGGGYTTLGTAPVNPDGTFSYDVVGVPLLANVLPIGVYDIQALFTATDSTKFASDADTLKQEVGIVPIVSVSLSNNTIERGELLTFTVDVAPDDSDLVQPGSVTLIRNGVDFITILRGDSTVGSNGSGHLYSVTINTADPQYNFLVSPTPYVISARYNRNDSGIYNTTSSLASQNLTITNQRTDTVLTVTPGGPVFYGDQVDLAVSTSPHTVGSIIPFAAGSITFSDTLDGTISGPNTTKAGVNPSSSFSTTNLTVGSHTLTATYNGDATNYAASTSNGVNIVVNKANTTLAFTSSPTPAIVNLGSSINFTVVVSTPAINASLKPTGNVVFSSGSTIIQTVAINQSNGTATYTYTPSATGIETITASYSGDGNYQLSSNTLVVTVPTITLATFSANTVQRGNPITLSAAIDIDPLHTNIDQPGSIDFLYGSTIVTSVPRSASTLVNGKQVYTTTINTGDNAFNLPVSATPYNIYARYNRDGGNYPSQTSSTQPLNIVQQSSSIILTGLPNTSSTTSTITYGDRIDLTTNLNSFINNSIIPFASNATGIVIRDGSTIIARLPIANDARAAVLTKTDFTVGTHVLTAEFVGDTNYALSTSPAFTLIVNQAVTRLNLTSNSDYLALGQTFTVSAAVESTAATMPTAISGNVVFVATDSKGGTTNLATGTIFNGKASSTFTPTVAGHYVISAQYIGDTNYAGTLSSRTVTASSISIQIQDPSTLFGTSIFQRGSDINFVATLTPGDTASVDQITGLPVQPGAVSFILPNGTVVATVSRASSYDLNGSRIYSTTVNSGNLLYSLPVGTTTVRSRYNVDGGLYPLVSSAASPLTIIKQDTTTTLTGSISGTLPYGSPVSFDATVSPTINAFGVTENEIPFGKSQIQFFDGSNLILASAVDNTTRSAPLSLSALSVGQHIITARYATDGLNYAASKSSSVNITIAKAATTTDVSLSRTSIDAGDTVILTAQVGSNVNGAALNPSGTVTFFLKNGAALTAIGSAPLNSTTGLATFSYKPTSVKSYEITATYSGDSNYATSNSTADPDTLRVKTFQPFYAVALQGGSVLATYNTRTNALIARYQPMGPNYRGGFTVARGDVNADGVSDLLYAPNKGSFVRIIDGRSSHDLGGFFAFGSNFGQAISIAVGDISGDGKGDIMVAPAGRGAAGIVRVFSGANFSNLLYQGTPYGAGFAGGISLASADVNGDGRADIITAPLSGGASRIVVVSGATRSVIRDYLAFGSSYIGGANVTAADINGDGKAEIIVGAMVGRGNIVVQDGATNTQRASFFAYQAGYNGGARVAAISDVNADGFLDLVVTPGAGGGTKASRYSGANYRLIDSFFAFSANEPGSNGGMRPA